MSSSTIKSKKRKLNSEADEIEEIHMHLMRMIVACGLAFSIVENPFFKIFVKSLNNSYSKKIPCRGVVSDRLLKKLHGEVTESIKDQIPKEGCILIDSWKNSSGKTQNFAIMVHNAGEDAHLVNTYDVSNVSETAINLSEMVSETKTSCFEKYGCSFFAMVSDNAANMIKTGRELSHILWFSRCMAHLGNLLAKDILDDPIRKKVIAVQTFFRHLKFTKLIKDEGGSRPTTPSDVRWCYYRDTFKNFLANLNIYKKIQSTSRVEPEISEIINNNNIIQLVQKQLELLDPICEVINKCQEKNASLSDGAEAWLKLKSPNNCTNSEKSAIEERRSLALTDIALAAYYIDPFKDNAILTPDQLSTGRSFITQKLKEHLRGQLIRFEAFDATLLDIKKNVDCAADFWEFAECEVPELSNIAKKLSRIPASTAQLERSFSMWQNIHSKLRNRMIFEKSRMLMECYYYFANMKKYLKNNVLDYI